MVHKYLKYIYENLVLWLFACHFGETFGIQLEKGKAINEILVKIIIKSNEVFQELCPPVFLKNGNDQYMNNFENIDLFSKNLLPSSFLDENFKFPENSANGMNSSETPLKYNYPCKTFVIFVGRGFDINFVNTAISSGDSKPQSDRYVFIGEFQTIQNFLKTDDIPKHLKLKMGIGTGDGIFLFSPVDHLPETYSVTQMLSVEDPVPSFSSQWFNLRGRILTATWMNLSPYIFNTSETTYMGFCYNVLKYSSKMYNISIKLQPNWQKYGGFQLPNGTWVGSVGAVLYGEVDFSAVIAPTEKRYQIIDFSTDLLTDFFIFVTAHPTQHTNWLALLYPFTINCWLLIIFTFSAILPVFYFSLEKNSSDSRFYRAFLITYSISVDQGVAVEKGIKFILMFWMFFIMIIGTGYRSNLVSFLSFPELEKVPESFQDLADRKDYTLHYNYNGGAGYAFFNYTTNPMYRSLLNRFVLIRNVEQCVISSLIQRKTVCLGWKLFVPAAVARMLTISQNFEPLHSAKQHSHTLTIAFAFKKKSQYTESFSRITSILRDTGNVDKWARDVLVLEKLKGRKKLLAEKSGNIYKKMKQVYREMSESGVKPFKIVNFGLVFSAYSIAVIFLIAQFLREFLHGKCRFRLRR